MMLFRILGRDLSRRKGSLLLVFCCIFLSSLLAAGGAGLISDLTRSLEAFFNTAKAPHFVQMHGGMLSADDQAELALWARENSRVQDWQISEMISVDGVSLRFSRADESEADSIMDISLVVQNQHFDYLLDMENRICEPASGEIGVPVYYAREKGITNGDSLTLSYAGWKRDFRVSLSVRDPQMNPALVHSKRFLVNRKDFLELSRIFPDREYLISFRLKDPSTIDEFSTDWQEADLPGAGPAIDYRIFSLLNSISDGMAAAVLVFLGVFFLIIGVLCLRFIILGAIEEDYSEIGVLKAVGLPRGQIRRIFLFKYLFISGCAAVSGSFVSLLFCRAVSSNIMFSIGRAPLGISRYFVPIGAAGGILLLVFLLLIPVFRRLDRISAVDALRYGSMGEGKGKRRALALRRFWRADINIVLGLRDIVLRPRLFALPLMVYFFSAVIMLIPFHFLTTLKGPDFISYMGIGRSDIRIDLRYSEDTEHTDFEEMAGMLKNDPDIERYAVLLRSGYRLLTDSEEGSATGGSLVVENGNHALFPLNYLEGGTPQSGEDIAVSYLYSRDLDKTIGDTLRIEAGGESRRLRICGIYQDITNGGRTAKASFDGFPGIPQGCTFALDLNAGVDVEEKTGDLSSLFRSARVTHLESYLEQTLGPAILQLTRLIQSSIALGVGIAVLITALFIRMLAARDSGRIAMMRTIGFSSAAVRLQYLTSVLVLLGLGIAAGSLCANTLGQSLAGFLWGFMGAPGIHFVVDPLKAYLLLPLMLLFSVAAAASVSIAGSLKENISVINIE